jgi:glycosyltransferase involved in cell wall biosynthesis
MRICLVYDCLFPHTIGGAERWYRDIAARLAADGHDVTYVTLRQWGDGVDPGFDGVHVVSAGPRMALYADEGRRRVLPPIVFGAGVLWHLLRHGRRYDVVHAASFPYFSLLAAGLVRRLRPFRLLVDWFEVWTLAYWQGYLGRVAGYVGWQVQRLCMRVPQTALTYSRIHGARLRDEGFRGDIEQLGGLYGGSLEPASAAQAEPFVVFAGRQIPEKQAPAVVHAVAAARRLLPELRARVLGDGPDRSKVLAAIAEHGLEGAVDAPGFVSAEEVDAAMRSALALVFPSRREGFGLVVVEAAHRGTPSIVVDDPDNASTELVDDGVNGYVAASASADDLAAAIVRVHAEGLPLRERTAAWFDRNAERLALGRTLDRVATIYASAPRTRRSSRGG